MMRAYIIAALAAVGVAAVAQWSPTKLDVVEFYGGNMRGPLFTGFLGLGGFLLSLKTFIIVKMKEGLYDHKIYRARFAESKKDDPKGTGKLFDRLGRLRALLFAAIVSSLLTAVVQMTIGLVKEKTAVVLCLAAAGFTIALLAQSLVQINGNLKKWFEYLELDAEDQERDAASQTIAEAAQAPVAG